MSSIAQDFFDYKICVHTSLDNAVELVEALLAHGCFYASTQTVNRFALKNALRRGYRNRLDAIGIVRYKIPDGIVTPEPAIGHALVSSAIGAGYKIVDYETFITALQQDTLADIDSVI